MGLIDLLVKKGVLTAEEAQGIEPDTPFPPAWNPGDPQPPDTPQWTGKYIGARYVPKIMGAWDSNLTYEPLMIVWDSIGNSYTSRSTVPAGTPLSDTKYWALTGQYNAQINNLQEMVRQVATDLTDEESNREVGDTHLLNKINNEITNREHEFTNLNNNKLNRKMSVILCGDSYGADFVESDGTVVKGWGWNVQNILGNVYTVYDQCIGGMSFGNVSPDWNYLKCLETLPISVDKNSIDLIVVFGGHNDILHTSEQIISGVQNFMNYCKQNFPNAKVMCGFIGGSMNPDYWFHIPTAIEAYNQASKLGMIYIPGMDIVMRYPRFFREDKVHPTAIGIQALCEVITNAIVYNTTSSYDYLINETLVLSSPFSEQSPVIITNIGTRGMNILNYTSIMAININGNVPTGGSWFEFGTLTFFQSWYHNCNIVTMNVILQIRESGKYFTCPAAIMLDGNKIMMSIQRLNENGTGYVYESSDLSLVLVQPFTINYI